MTPREFFNRIIGEESRYVIAGYIREIVSKNDSAMLEIFIEDVDYICDKWRLDVYDESVEEYYREMDILTAHLLAGEMKQEDYNACLHEEPQVIFPDLPENVAWAVEELNKGLDSPIPQPDTSTPVIADLVIDTSTGATPTTGASPEKWRLPRELDTDRTRKYFARAIERGWMVPAKGGAGFKWLMGGERGGKARLGYFVVKVYCPTNTENVPEQAINNLFGVSRIGSAITQVFNSKEPQKWRLEIDSIFVD